MAAPPARTEISDVYPNPSNAVARTGFGKLWDFVTGLLGLTGLIADARAALGFGTGVVLLRTTIYTRVGGVQMVSVDGGAPTSTGATTFTKQAATAFADIEVQGLEAAAVAILQRQLRNRLSVLAAVAARSEWGDSPPASLASRSPLAWRELLEVPGAQAGMVGLRALEH